MAKASNPAIAPAAITLEIVRTFDAPRALVFACWTQEKHMAHWHAPAGFSIVRSFADVRAGGEWNVVMRSPKGEDHEAAGQYREVTPNDRLVLTHGWVKAGKIDHATTITVTFTDDGPKTRMRFVQGPFISAPSRDGHAGGWSETFDQLQSYLKQLTH